MIILGISGRRFERSLGYEVHCHRAKLQGWKPLSQQAYSDLCSKIEAMPK